MKISLVSFLFLFLVQMSSGQDSDSVLIYKVSINGNKVTHKTVILRELDFTLGSKVARISIPERLKTSRENLAKTSLFLESSVTDSIVGDNLEILVTVRERWYVIPEPKFIFTDRNFNEWISHPTLYRTEYGLSVTDENFRGRNEKLGFDFMSGWRHLAGINYSIPYVNKKKTIGFRLGTEYETGHELGVNTVKNRLQYLRVDEYPIIKNWSAFTSVTYRPRFRQKNILSLSYSYYRIADTVISVNPAWISNTASLSKGFFTAGYTWIYDNRNTAFYPMKGWLASASITNSGFQKDLNVTLLSINGRWYVPVTRSQRFSYAGGVLAQQNLQQTLPYLFRNSLGYRWQVRGYEHYVIDGNRLWLLSTDFRYRFFDHVFRMEFIPVDQFNRIPIQIYFKVFTDAGAVYYPMVVNHNTATNQYLQGYGAGVDIISFYDKIMRLEYSFNLFGESELFLHWVDLF